MLSTHQEMRTTRFSQTARAYTTRGPVAVIAEDSDVFQLQVHHADSAASNVYMVAESRPVCATTIKRRVDIQLSESLVFLHVISSCDDLKATWYR